MKPWSCIIVGAGQSGLAMSRQLSARGLDHVLLERGRVANAWRTERWDSLRLLTPNWRSRLPGARYRGPDPDGFMRMPEVAAMLARYANACAAPVETDCEVRSVRPDPAGYRIETSRGPYLGRTLVLATGACSVAKIPGVADAVPASVHQTTPLAYKRPSDVPDGRVLVVGASASGVQIAQELARAGRPVTLAVGGHVRVPRRYRGCDIHWRMEQIGAFDLRYDAVDDLARLRRAPSLQLAGGRATLDLNALQDDGVEITGRLADIRGGKALFSGGLANACVSADLKMARLLDAIDAWLAAQGLANAIAPPMRFPPTRVPKAPRLSIGLGDEIRGIVWATGYRPDFSWLRLPVFDRKGGLRHDGGVVMGAPGVFAMGLPFLRRRKSTLIDGAGDDARDLAEHLAFHLRRRSAA